MHTPLQLAREEKAWSSPKLLQPFPCSPKAQATIPACLYCSVAAQEQQLVVFPQAEVLPLTGSLCNPVRELALLQTGT